MAKKIISMILVVSVVLYLGCHDTVRLTRDKFIAKDPSGDLLVITKNVEYYRFPEHLYWITTDSLKGSGMRTHDGTTAAFSGSIPLTDIDIVEMDELNGSKTVLCVLGITVALAAVVVAVAAASFANSWNHTTQNSCPFVYTYDGTSYHFESETFSGAVLKGLERTSYDNLHFLKPVNGTYRLKLANERNETQYVNELKLLVIDHPESTAVIPDMRGAIHTIAHAQPPLGCVDFSNHDAMKYIMSNDTLYWTSDLSTKDFSRESDLRDGIILEFSKPQHATQAKLLVNGVNTGLGDFAFKKIFQLKGDNKLLWYQQLERNSSERGKFLAWMMREGMLHVKVWENGDWKEQNALLDVGPLIPRDQIALLDVANIQGSVLKVKLECTTDLWRINKVSIDYSRDMPVKTAELSAASAINERSQDVTEFLVSADDQYYVTISGQHADLTFNAIPRIAPLERSYVLKTRGFYYQWIDSYGPENNVILERVLNEPQFAAKQYLPEWRNVKSGYDGIQKTKLDRNN